MIYADNAATTKMSERAKKVMLETADSFWENPSSLHTPGQKAAVQERSFFVGQISRQAGGSVRQARAAGRLCVV